MVSTAVGVVGGAGYARVSIELRRCRSRRAAAHPAVKVQACSDEKARMYIEIKNKSIVCRSGYSYRSIKQL